MENWENKKVSEDSLKALNGICQELFENKAKIDSLANQQKELNKKNEELKAKVLAYLEENGLARFDSAHGLVSIKARTSAKIVDKFALFEELRKQGIFDSLATVNSQTLNAFFKAEKEKAAEQGNYNYALAGVDYSEFTDISMRKK